MKTTLRMLGLLLSSLLVACGSNTLAPATPTLAPTPTSVPALPAIDPASVIDAYTAALNGHDIDAVLAFFTDDAIFISSQNLSFPGKSEIRIFMRAALLNVHFEPAENLQVAGDEVTWVQSFTHLGGQPRTDKFEAIIQGGKFKSLIAMRAELEPATTPTPIATPGPRGTLTTSPP